MDAKVRQLVRDRAGHRCEFCKLRQPDLPLIPFHIEHVIPTQHGGPDDLSNLALACHRCNLNKGPNLASLDPLSGAMVPLFHPRLQNWEEHFAWQGVLIVGLTPTGRATVRILAMNEELRLQLRRCWLSQGPIY